MKLTHLNIHIQNKYQIHILIGVTNQMKISL